MQSQTPDAILSAAAGLLGMSTDQLKDALAKAKTKGTEEPEQLLTRKEAAKLFKVSEKTLQNWDRSGRLTPVKLGYRSLRYRTSDLQRLLSDSGKAA